jgi:hypothetical protein
MDWAKQRGQIVLQNSVTGWLGQNDQNGTQLGKKYDQSLLV